MAEYSPIVRLMKARYRVRGRRWRRSMSGRAGRVTYDAGRSINWIEAPLPRTPISLSIFLHEVGHHAIGFDKYRRRCEEEFFVWKWALGEMPRHGVKPDARVHRRVEASMRYAVGKAVRRGIKEIPAALVRYLPEAA